MNGVTYFLSSFIILKFNWMTIYSNSANFFSRSLSHLTLFSCETDFTILWLIQLKFLYPIVLNTLLSMAFLIRLPISSEYIILGLFMVVIRVTPFKFFNSGTNPKPRGWWS